MATEQSATLTSVLRGIEQATGKWFEENGQQFINTLEGAFCLSAAAHAGYLATVPEALRIPASKRSQRFWKRFSVGTLLAVAVFDSLHNASIARQQQHLQQEAKELQAKLQSYTGDL